MALAETAKLAVEIGLTDKVTPGIRKMQSRISGLGPAARKTGKAIGVGLAAGLAAGTAIVAANVRSGIDSLVELESAVTSVDGAIAQLGLTGQVTGAQVAAWANEIEESTQAAFDDKAIAAATANLIRYGKVTPKTLRKSMEVMTDLAAKTGDVESASTLLGKALADPTKAAGKLARMGIILTKVEQDKIKALDKAGKSAEAQALLLDILARSTKGAAAASKGPMADAQATLADVTEDAQRALAEGFLPVLMRVQKGLSKALADPKTLSAIRSFGQGLAAAFDNVVAFAEKIDWGRIGSGLKVAADWGGKFINAIAQMPPEVLGALIALGGLNKLSGGAVSGIVGELGRGLVKGVLGINAGVVNLRAASVTGGGVGGGTAAGGKAGKVGSALGLVSKVFLVGAAAGVAAELWGIKQQQTAANEAQGTALRAQTSGFATTATPPELRNALKGVREEMNRLNNSWSPEGLAYALNIDGVRDNVKAVESKLDRQLTALYDTKSEAIAQRLATEGVKAKQAESIVAFRAGERQAAAGNAIARASDAKLAAIRAKKTSFNMNTIVNVSTAVSVTTLQKHSRYKERVARTGTLVAS